MASNTIFPVINNDEETAEQNNEQELTNATIEQNNEQELTNAAIRLATGTNYIGIVNIW